MPWSWSDGYVYVANLGDSYLTLIRDRVVGNVDLPSGTFTIRSLDR